MRGLSSSWCSWLLLSSAMAMATTACGGDRAGVPGGSAGAGGEADGGHAMVGGAGVGGSGMGGAGVGGSGGSTATPCPDGVTCVDTFPFHDERDTSLEGSSAIDGYACMPAVDESGQEIFYRVTVPEDGFLSVAVYDESGVDVDLHILSALDPTKPDGGACVARGDKHAAFDVTAGDWWVVADTYVADGSPLSGPYALDIGFHAPSVGPCAMEVGEMPRVGDGGDHLPMPATGPIVMEAHLVTDQEPPPYPSTPTEELVEHYGLSQMVTGFVMHRGQDWAPLEGGDHYGAGIGSPTDFPTLHEGWYVNMYWTAQARPPKGTRMVLRDPNGERAVVVAAGYETGPGNLAHVGGTPEETHFYMGTGHLDDMTIGIALDQSLPFGPRRCTD